MQIFAVVGAGVNPPTAVDYLVVAGGGGGGNGIAATAGGAGGAGGLINNAPAMAITAAPPSKIRERLCILPAPSVPGCRAAARARNTHDQRQDRQQYRHGGDVQNT